MARTKQTARTSTGGRAPRRSPREPSFHIFEDHAGSSAVTTHSAYGPKNHVSRLSLQPYTLSAMKESAQELCQLFLQTGLIRNGSTQNYWPRVDVYKIPLGSLEDCIQHHHFKQELRKNSGGPHIVPNWSKRNTPCSRPYRNVIFVVDKGCDDWQMVLRNGLLSVQYDLEIRPEDHFDVLEADELVDPHDEGLVELNPVPDDPLVETVIVGLEKEDEMRLQRQADWANGNHLATYQPTLPDVWGRHDSDTLRLHLQKALL